MKTSLKKTETKILTFFVLAIIFYVSMVTYLFLNY